jgi:hypothetical protein
MQPRLLQNTPPSALRHVSSRLTCNRDTARFVRMFVLPMAAYLVHKVPSLLLYKFCDFSEFHDVVPNLYNGAKDR